MSKKIQKIVSVTTSVATIAWLSGVGMLAPMAAMATTMLEGDTIKTATNPDVYIVKYVGASKYKRLVLNPDVFNSYGHLSWSKIKTVTQAEMDTLTTSDLVRAQGDTKVYKLVPNGDVGSKQWVNMTAEAFTAGGWDWNSIYVINNVDRDNYSATNDITGGTPANPTTGTTTGGTTVTPSGAVTVALASDTPAAGIAVGGAARIPFTKVNFTAGATAATITSLTIQRTGLADDLALSSITLIDNDTNMLVGLAQTLNSAHQAVIAESLTIPANTTKSYTLAANMGALSTTYSGQVASLSLVAVASAGTVVGTLPITGNGQTINGTLVLGTATVTAGNLDPGTAITKNVGTTAYNTASLKITAGSTEDITVYSIRWNQSGSAATSDLGNVVVTDGTTDYTTTVSSDGKYYTANFGTTGIVITKGLNKSFTVKADVLSGSARTFSFDIYRNTDVMVKGNLYGYYLTPAFTANSAVHSGATTPTTIQEAIPYFQSPHVTIGAGALRVDKSSTGAPSANITRGATGQVLGAFDFVVTGESVNVTAMILDFDMTGTGSSSDVTSVTLNKTDGSVIATGGTSTDQTAGHLLSTLDSATDGHVHFSGTMTFPVGTTQVIVKGNLNTDFVADDTFRVGFVTLGTTGVTGITGATTGNTITATPAGALFGNTMTVKGGSLTAHISGSPVSQTVIAGVTGFTFSNIILDAGASGEDIKVSQIILNNNYVGSDVFSVQLFDGATALNTGSNVLSTPDATGTPDTNTITLDTPLIVAKGTSKTIAVKGNILASATTGDTQQWGLSAAANQVVATGKDTGSAITTTLATAEDGPTMTIAAHGQYSVALDSSTPISKLYVANTTGNTMTTLRFRATAEQINITKLTLGLTGDATTTASYASSTCNDISKVYVYDGATLLNPGGSVLGIGNAVGGSNNASSTITLTTPLVLLANTDKVVTIKADIASMDDTTSPAAIAGHRISIDFYGNPAAGITASSNEATGMSSGVSIVNYSVSTGQAVSYIQKSIPTITKLDVATTKLTNSTMDLFKFKVAADAKGDIDLYKFTFRISTSVATVTYLNVVDVTESSEVTLYASGTQAIKPWSDGTNDLDVVLMASPGTPGGTPTPRTVTAGTTRTFVVRGTITGATTNATVVTQMQGDVATCKAWKTHMTTAASIDACLDDDFIWSDRSAASHAYTTSDWTNGYLVDGLPSSNTVGQTLSF